MKFKNYLSLLMSCIMLAEPFAANAQSVKSKSDNSKPSVTQFVKGKISECNDWLDANPKTKKILKGVGIAAAVGVGLKTLGTATSEIWFNCASHTIPGLKKINNNGDNIKKQEGLMWCWNACLQRALHKYGIEKSQKEIYKGITDKSLVSPLKVKRDTANVAAFSREELEDKNFLVRLNNKGHVFDEEIKAYVEKVTNNKYTYQTLYVPWGSVGCKYMTLSSGEIYYIGGDYHPDGFYALCGKLREAVAKKNSDDQRKVALLTLCPIVNSAHEITIEDTRGDEFIMGEPMAGVTVSLAKSEFFKDGYFLCSPITQRTYSHGLPLSFIIKKGCEIPEPEWDTMCERAFREPTNSAQ